MTQREFYNAVRANESNTEEIRAFAAGMIEKLDVRNNKRSSVPTAKQKENEELKVEIMDYIMSHSTETVTGAGLAEILTTEERPISTNRASALLRQLVVDEKLTVADIKNPKGKGKVKGYSIV